MYGNNYNKGMVVIILVLIALILVGCPPVLLETPVPANNAFPRVSPDPFTTAQTPNSTVMATDDQAFLNTTPTTSVSSGTSSNERTPPTFTDVLISINASKCASSVIPSLFACGTETEFGWSGGTANDDDLNKFTWVKVMNREVFGLGGSGGGMGVTIELDYKNGALTGYVFSNDKIVFVGQWFQDSDNGKVDQGDFELIFNQEFTEATGWWSNKRNQIRYSAVWRIVNK